MECDGCTLCCKLLDVKWLDSPAGQYCKECNVNHGCRVYNTRPAECSKFDCMYTQMQKSRIEVRPDQCHLIFEKISGRVIWATKDPDVHISFHGKIQMLDFRKQGYSVVIREVGKKPILQLAVGHTKEMVINDIKRHLRKIRQWQHTEQT